MNTRESILDLVRRYPGLHLREVARQLDTSVALIEYHVPELERLGQLEAVADEGTRRLFATDVAVPRRAVAALRDHRRLKIVLLLLEHGALRHGQLVEASGLGKSTLSFHLRRLERALVLTSESGAYQLANPVVMKRLLAKHGPTPDAVDRVGSLWSNLYGN